MRSPKATPEDPAIVAQREREQLRAESARTEETQALTLADTLTRLRRFGRLPGRASSSVPIYGGGAVGGARGGGAASSGSGGGGTSEAAGSNGGGRSVGGSSRMDTVLY